MGKKFLLPITYYLKRPSVVPTIKRKRWATETIFCDISLSVNLIYLTAKGTELLVFQLSGMTKVEELKELGKKIMQFKCTPAYLRD